ncbi:MAG: VanW family protein [Clostridia bacterium]|nr:VanW family protein [Clostridia bacterium]
MEGNQPRQRRSGENAQRVPYPNYPQYPASGSQPQQYAPQGQPYAQYGSAYQPPTSGQARQGRRADRHQGGGSGPYRKGRDGLWLLLIIICIALLVAGGFSVSSLYSRYPAFKSKVQILSGNTFYNGVHIDGIHVGGMTMEEARAAVSHTNEAIDQRYALSVTIDGKTWRITQNELPLQRNTEGVLEEAFSIGRQTPYEALQSGMTPFQYRSQAVQEAERSGAYLYTQVTYDKATVRALSDKLSGWVSTPAQDATIAGFDFTGPSFQYQSERAGTALTSDEIYAAITARMDARDYNGQITLSTHPQQPSVTVAQLQQSFGLIASYSTDTLPDRNRNKNIELACIALNGTVLESGKTLSFNEITGRRTVDKGYLMAGAIAQGRSYEESGGGVCQVSSTLFNAAVLADLKIVTSSPHAWPSAYVEPGRDATVDWQNFQSLDESLDLKIRNSSAYPVYIRAYMNQTNTSRICLCTVEIYGVARQDGLRVALETELEGGEPIPSPTPKKPEIVPADEEHPAGTEEIIVKGREGFKYKTFRVYYKDDAEVRRELIRNSYYKPYAEQLRIYE